MAGRGARRRRAREQAFGELATPPARPDEIVGRIELQRLLAGLVLELAPPQRDVLLLHYFEDLTSRQIGLRLGISPGTVRWRLKQAIDELRDRLEQRSKHRAWLPPLAAFARTAPSAKVALLPQLLFAAFLLLAICAFVLRAQVGEAQRVAPTGAGAHAPSRPPDVPMLNGAASPERTSATLDSGQIFSAEQQRIRGTVIDGNGQGVAGADVELDCGYEDGVKLKQRTGAGGAFAFEIDPHCRYVVTATKGDARGEQSWSLSNLHTPPGISAMMDRFRALGVAVQLRHSSLAVIRVVDAQTGAPIANATISSGGLLDDGVSAITGPDGTARMNIRLPSRITVDADDYAQAREVLEGHAYPPSSPRVFVFGDPQTDRSSLVLGEVSSIDVPARAGLEVRLSRGIAVSGTVVSPDGDAVAGASVVLSGPLGAPRLVDTIATADARGSFEMKVPVAGRYVMFADRRALASNDAPWRPFPVRPGSAAVQIPAAGRTNLVAHVVSLGEIRGTVVDLGSNPVAGARVSVADGTIRPVVTDAQGRFVIENVRGSIAVIARRGTEASAFQRVQVAPGGRANVVLPIGPTGIAGIAVDHDGAPVEGAEVWLNVCCDWDPRLVEGTRYTTDATGRFSFDVPRGHFVLSVRRYTDDDYQDEDDLEVTGGSRDVRLVVP